MPSEFAPDIQAEINQFLAAGSYPDGESVVRNALAALKFRDAEVAAIAEGIADMEEGNVRPLREFDRDFRLRKNLPPVE